MKTNKILLLVIVVRLVWLCFNNTIEYSPDSVSYFYRYSIVNGHPHPFRMIIYPELINLMTLMGLNGNHLLLGLVLFQHTVSFFVLVYLLKSIRLFIKNERAQLLSFILISCNPLILSYNNNVNTESLSISLVILLIYVFLKINKGHNPDKNGTYKTYGLILLLVLIRPVFLYLVILPLVVFIRNEYRNLTTLKKHLISLTIIVVLLSSFIYLNKKNNYYNGLSTVSLINKISNIAISRSYESNKDSILVKKFDIYRVDGFYNVVSSVFPYNAKIFQERKHNVPKYLLENTPDYVIKKTDIEVNRLEKFVNSSFYSFSHLKYVLKKIISMLETYCSIVLSVFLEMLIIIYALLARKIVLLDSTILVGFVMGLFLMIAVFGIDDWTRLLSPAMPVITLIVLKQIDTLLLIFDANIIYSIRNKIKKYLHDT